MMRIDRGCLALPLLLIAFVAPSAMAYDAEPLPYPVYVSCRVADEFVIDGTLSEPAWRETSPGWGLSNSLEPNVLTPDPTLFRIAWNDTGLVLSLACYKRPDAEKLPDNIWKPQEPDVMDLQATPRYARMRGVTPPTNSADILLSHESRTVTMRFIPPEAPKIRVHDALGDRPAEMKVEFAYQGTAEDALWTAEARVSWEELGFEPPVPVADWALNLYRDIRFFSNWSFIAWMRNWDKTEYSRFDLTERFGRVLFVDEADLPSLIERAEPLTEKRGPVRLFAPDSLVLVYPGKPVVRQRYAEQLKKLRAFGEEMMDDRNRNSSDLPYYPFFNQKEPRQEIKDASKKLARLREMMNAPLAWDDPASGVALISHALPEARQGIATYNKERLYRGLPE